MYMTNSHNVLDIFITKLLDRMITNYKLAWRQIKQRTLKVIWNSLGRKKNKHVVITKINLGDNLEANTVT